jgi:hypothetical protein
MKNKIAFCLLAVLLITSIIIPSPVWGEMGAATINVSVKVDFPATLTFDISVKDSKQITDIRLEYNVDRIKNTDITTEKVVAFTPSNDVSAQYVIDMRQTGGLPPGSSLNYWLKVTDASGAITQTAPQKLVFNDERYEWSSLSQGMITLYWYNGDDGFAEELMNASQQALSRLSENTGAELKNPVKMYIYADSIDLRGAMIYAQDWTGGVAFTEYGIIAIGIWPSASQMSWGKSAITHELTHLVVHQVTFNPYNTIPPWLDEGLAMYAEGPLDTQFTVPLEEAVANNTLISVRSLCSPFSAYPEQAILAYGESYQIVKYLIDEYGQEKMFELLIAFSKGSSYDDALEAVYGFNIAGLNTQWQTAAVAAP